MYRNNNHNNLNKSTTNKKNINWNGLGTHSIRRRIHMNAADTAHVCVCMCPRYVNSLTAVCDGLAAAHNAHMQISRRW